MGYVPTIGMPMIGHRAAAGALFPRRDLLVGWARAAVGLGEAEQRRNRLEPAGAGLSAFAE